MIEITVAINAPLSKVWDAYVSVDAVQYWGFASDDWAAEGIENDVRVGGTFKNRNFAKDGSMEFMFGGTYSEVEPEKRLAYSLDDGRKVEVEFSESNGVVTLNQRFEPEVENDEAFQKAGWQGYLDNFKKFVETSKE